MFDFLKKGADDAVTFQKPKTFRECLDLALRIGSCAELDCNPTTNEVRYFEKGVQKTLRVLGCFDEQEITFIKKLVTDRVRPTEDFQQILACETFGEYHALMERLEG